jgi:CDP-paratose synthetase
MAQKALVTGGTGFIGGELVKKLLERGYEVCVIAKKHQGSNDLDQLVKTHILDDESQEFSGEFIHNVISSFKPDAIYHLAALQPKNHNLKDIDQIINANITLGCLILECANKLGGIPFVNIGTYWQYYNGTETDPVNLYSATKSAFQEIIKYYINACANPIATLILVDTYGENDKRGKILNLLIESAFKQEPIKLSPGEQMLDFIHVDDVVEGMIYCAVGLKNKTIDAGTYVLREGRAFTLKKIADIVEKIANKKVQADWGAIPYAKRQIMNVCIPWKNLPNWRAKIKLDNGIRILINKYISKES